MSADAGARAERRGKAAEPTTAPAPQVVVAVQPGDGGPLEDWLNLERCQPSDGLLVSVNGAFDKLRGGFYPRPLFPKLAECVDRFVVDAEALVVLKNVADKGRAGWLFRVYPEPWQLFAQGKGLVSQIKEVAQGGDAAGQLLVVRPNGVGADEGRLHEPAGEGLTLTAADVSGVHPQLVHEARLEGVAKQGRAALEEHPLDLRALFGGSLPSSFSIPLSRDHHCLALARLSLARRAAAW